MKPAADSEEILHARQALNAYEHQRAEGNLPAALEHLKRAIDCVMLAVFAVEDELARKVPRGTP